MLRNSWGETVTFMIESKDASSSVAKIQSTGKSAMGMHVHDRIFKKMRKSLDATLNSDIGVTTVQEAAAHSKVDVVRTRKIAQSTPPKNFGIYLFFGLGGG